MSKRERRALASTRNRAIDGKIARTTVELFGWNGWGNQQCGKRTGGIEAGWEKSGQEGKQPGDRTNDGDQDKSLGDERIQISIMVEIRKRRERQKQSENDENK